MTRSVELPLWALLLILAFAAVTFASHFLFPSVRWFFRKRLERAVVRLNERLTRPIEPFKLTRRYDMIQRLIYDPKVTEAVVEFAREEGVPEQVGFEKAQRYAREIVPGFSAFVYFGVGLRLARFVSRAFYRVRVGAGDNTVLSSVDPDATVIFVINHRSNIDYFLIGWLASEQSTLSYAVGEWARRWPLSALIRSVGAYFIRRKSRNVLYRRVLARYVQMATEGGVTQAIFPEGGLSLNGTVGAPKLGLLNYIVSGYRPGQGRDVVFVPVALNYDRVLEDRVLVAADVMGERKFRLRWKYSIRHVSMHLWQRITGRFHRFGYASVGFGTPLSLAEFAAGREGELTEPLALEVMARIRKVVPVLPLPLVAAILLEHDGLTRAEIEARFEALIADLTARKAHVHMPRGDSGYAVEVGLRLLLLRKLIGEDAGCYRINPPDRPIVQFYANSIAHLTEEIAPIRVVEGDVLELNET